MVHDDCLAHDHKYTEDDELHLRHLLAQTVVCKVISSPNGSYDAAINYIMKKCAKVIALWDDDYTNDTTVKFSGTLRGIEIAKKYGHTIGDDIKIIRCHR